MFQDTSLQEGMDANFTLSSNNLKKQFFFLLLTAHKISNHLTQRKIMHFFYTLVFSDVILYFINIHCSKDCVLSPKALPLHPVNCHHRAHSETALVPGDLLSPVRTSTAVSVTSYSSSSEGSSRLQYHEQVQRYRVSGLVPGDFPHHLDDIAHRTVHCAQDTWDLSLIACPEIQALDLPHSPVYHIRVFSGAVVG